LLNSIPWTAKLLESKAKNVAKQLQHIIDCNYDMIMSTV